ncbi:kinase-like domain-containing protein [Collybia nuda]|uniref:Kinase-like domain-containing protein n=1 Tax=Collybia nuda TaxID=64659 RepID=A0A9P6CLP2_9AGAR|nr:kinase-like domain-containing protein [Collybia nuda]
MTTSPHDNIERQVRIRLAGFTGDVPLCHEGAYSYVARLPTELAASVEAPSFQDQRIRVFRSRISQEATDDILRTLVAQYRANPVAYHHPNITLSVPGPLHEGISGPMRPTTALLSPWFTSEDILAYVQNGSVYSKIKLAVQLAKAVEHLHNHNVVHGNIYPGNVFVTDQGKATLADACIFTLARLLYPDLTGSLVESSMYQAPEFLWPGTDAFVPPTTAMDVYALASTIFAILTESPPFQNVPSIRTVEQAVAKIYKVGHLCLPRPASGFCDELWACLQSCWSKIPGDRPSIGEIVTALEYIELYC